MRNRMGMVLFMVLTVSTASALAAEKEYKWDTFELSEGGMELAAMGGFVVGEAFAVRFEPAPGDYPILIKRVDLMFAGQMGEASVTKEVEYKIYQDTGSVNPGAELASGVTSLTSIDLMSGQGEIEALPSVDLLSEELVVNSGAIRVAFFHGWDGTPSIAADGSMMNPTITSGKNFIYASDPFGGGMVWYAAEALGVNGNWVMRMVVETQGGTVVDVVEPEIVEDVPPVETLSVDSISPDEGLNSEATAVIILGEGFESGLAVFVGTTEVDYEFITSVTSTKITATLPAGLNVGMHDIIVENPGGAAAVLEDAFEVFEGQTDMIIDSIVPGEGFNDEDTAIKILGAGFFDGVRVFIGATELVDASVTVTSDTLIDAVVPLGLEPGTYTVIVQGDEGQVATAPDAYTVKERDVVTESPEVYSVSPNWGPEDTEFEISVIGENFADGARVKLSGVKLATLFIDDETLQATIPEGKDAGSYVVMVENPDGETGSLVDGLKLYAPCIPNSQAFEKCVCGGIPIASGMFCCDDAPSNGMCNPSDSGGCSMGREPAGLVWLWLLLTALASGALALGYVRRRKAL